MVSGRRNGNRADGWITRLLDMDALWGALACGAILLIVSTQLGVRSYDYAPGDILEADIIAPVELRVPDPETTAQRRAEASDAVLDVYDFDPLAWREPVRSLNAVYGWGREQVEVAEGLSWSELTPSRRDELAAAADEVAGFTLPSEFVARAWDAGFAADVELSAEGLLRNQLRLSLIGTAVINLGGRSGIRIRDIVDQQERILDDPTSINDLETARARMVRDLIQELDRSAEVETAIAEMAGQLLRPNLTYNSNETQARRQAAGDAVAPVFYEVKRGRTIGREGDPVTPQMLRELRVLQQQETTGGARNPTFGMLLLIGLTIYTMWRYTMHHRERWRFQKVQRLYLLLLLVLVGQVALTRVLLFIGGAVAASMPQPPYNDVESYLYVIPLAATPLLVMLLADTHVAWVYAAFQALIIAVTSGSLELGIYGALGSFAAVYGMSRFVERTEMLRTGVTIGVVNVLVVCGLSLVAQPVPPWPTVVFRSVLGGFGAIQVALLASSLLPVLEGLFNTLTDVKLLELSNMNLPLLRQLAVVAPGTYHHSVVIGTLAEKAAQAIGANPLHARVAAYYHDVGKMRQPEYFVENQKDGHNPHDKLSPHMSALVLVRHVKDGVAYAQEHRLPQPLVDAIPQHHGTRLMRYFYERAKANTDPSIETVKEEDFRYPGPKPQSKEAALIMLADGVEAMSRLIDDPTPVRLREMIHKNVRSVLEDGQLDECEITLSDLARVEEAFLEVLAGMHHHRIEYPEETPVAVTTDPGASAQP